MISINQAIQTALVIDDENIVRGYFVAILELLGFKVLTADDGDIAIEVMEKNPDIELVVLDLNMKRISGWDAYPRLKGIKPDVKVIVSSGFMNQDDEKKLEAMGVDAVLKKPFPLLTFKATVRDVLGL